MPFRFFFFPLFSFFRLHVLHSGEQSRKVSLPFIGKCHTVPLNFLFLSPHPPTPSWHLFFPVQANWCFLLLGVERWASFKPVAFQTFLRSFLLICTQTVLSHDMNILNRILPGGCLWENPPFYFFLFVFFPLIHFPCGYFPFLNSPSQISTEWAQNVGSPTFTSWSSFIKCM